MTVQNHSCKVMCLETALQKQSQLKTGPFVSLYGKIECAGTWLRHCITQIIQRAEQCPNKDMYANHMTVGFAHSDKQFFAKKPKFCELRSMTAAMEREGRLELYRVTARAHKTQIQSLGVDIKSHLEINQGAAMIKLAALVNDTFTQDLKYFEIT